MDTPALLVEERQQKHLVLIVDKQNRFGSTLAAHVYQDATVVLVSQESPKDVSNIIFVPFTSTIPQIPDGSYSHIFFIWDGKKETLELLKPLTEKAFAENARFLFIVDYHQYDEELAQKILLPGIVGAIVLTGDIYDEPQETSRIPDLFIKVRQRSAIALPEMGLEPLYVVSWEDTIDSLLRVGLGVQKNKIFFAFSKHPHTMLALAHALQRVEPFLKIDFTNNTNGEPFVQLPKGEPLVEEKGQLKEIGRAFGLFLHAMPLKKEKEIQKEEKILPFVPQSVMPPRVRQKKMKLYSIVGLLFLFFITPLIFIAATVVLGLFFLLQTKSAAMQSNFSLAATYAQGAVDSFAIAQTAEMPIVSILRLVGQAQSASLVSQNIANGYFTSQSAAYGTQAFASFQKAQTAVLADSLFHDGTNSLKNALLTFERVDTSTNGIMYKDQLNVAKKAVTLLGDAVDVLPSLLGSAKKVSYLILFQNNMELRPSGGFIGSYATVSVEKGIVKDFHIHDVYDADGQLRGHVEPPFAIRRYIPLVHWYMRDSGFDVDFAKSAANAAFFLKQETGEQVDGVVGVDLSFLKLLLHATGSLYVPEYKETVDENNFFLLTEKHAEKNFFAGSSQKKDFLNAFFAAFQAKLMEKKSSPIGLLSAVLDALSQKHLLVSVADPSVQNVFTINGLSSTLWDGRKSAENTLLDFLGINEANIGVNKANYFISRDVAQDVAIANSGTVSAKITVRYKNTSDGTWPGGDYKNYLRFVLPFNTILRGITIDGDKKQLTAAITDPFVYESPKFLPPIGFEVEKMNESGKTWYGVLVNVPHQKTTTIDITYDYQQKIDIRKTTIDYSQRLFKQPGVDSYPFVFSLSYPQSLKVLRMPAGFVDSDGTITYKANVFSDIQKDIIFSQR